MSDAEKNKIFHFSFDVINRATDAYQREFILLFLLSQSEVQAVALHKNMKLPNIFRSCLVELVFPGVNR